MATLTLQPDGTSGVDTGIASREPTTNYGTDTILYMGNDALLSTAFRRALYKFDISDIPAGSVIDSCVLSLYGDYNFDDQTEKTFYAYRCTRNWIEGEATWNIYSTGNNWSTAGGGAGTDYVTTDGDSYTTDGVTPDPLGMEFTNLAALAQDALDSRSGILNLIIIGPEGSGSYSAEMDSSDWANASQRPKLVVNYSEQAVFYRLMNRAKTVIDAIGLDDSPEVVVRKVPVDRNIGADKTITFPAIILAPWGGEKLPIDQGPIQLDDIGYGIVCLMLDKDNQEGTIVANLNRTLAWRERIRHAFHLPPTAETPWQTLSTNLTSRGALINSQVIPMDATIREAWAVNYYASALLLLFTTREERGLN